MSELEPHDWAPPETPGRPWPSTRLLDPWPRLCAINARAFGYDHSPCVRAWMRRLVARARSR